MIKSAAYLQIVLCATAICAQDQDLVGRRFMPKEGCVVMLNGRPLTNFEITVPFVVRERFGDQLQVQNGSVNRADVVPLEEAIEYYDSLLAVNARNSWALSVRALTWKELGEPEKALNDYNASVAAEPGSVVARMNRAGHFYSLGKFGEALADLDEAIRLESESAQLYFNRSLIYQSKRDFRLAVRDMNSALALEQRNPTLLNQMAWLLATSPDEQIRDGRTAVSLAAQSVELGNPSDDGLRDTLAAALAEAGDFSGAIQHQKRAIELRRQSGNPDMSRYEARLRLYESGQAYHQ